MLSESFLVLFWALFFRGLLVHPYSFATADNLSTYFSHWRHLGKTLKVYDEFHFGKAWGLPFTSVWYPFHWITSILARSLKLDHAFIVYSLYCYSHYLFASIMWYYIFGNLFCAITMTYMMRVISSCQSVMFSWAWVPFSLLLLQHGFPLLGAVGVYMSVSGGYWPFLIYTIPFFIPHVTPIFLIASAVLVAPQVLLTAQYMKTSVRTKVSYKDKANGSLPPWHLISFLFPLRLNLGGVLYPELSYGIGRIAFVLAVLSLCIWPQMGLGATICVGVYLAMGKNVKAPILLRIPARAMLMVCMALIYAVSPIFTFISTEVYSVLLILQCVDLLSNHSSLVHYEPFVENGGKPSVQFRTTLCTYLYNMRHLGKVNNLPHPLFCGHITGIKGLGYCGGSMQIEDAKRRGITNMNGDGRAHDWFQYRKDGIRLDEEGIAFTYQPDLKTLNAGKWWPTPIKDLWGNRWLTQQN